MRDNWLIATIAECASREPYSTQIGPFGEKIRADIYTPQGAPVLRGTNVNPNGRFHDDDFVFINPEQAEKEFSKFVCEADDVILCHKGTLGKIGVIPKNGRFKKYIMGNSMMKVRCDRKKLHPLYLYYWLCSREGQDYIFSRVSQVGVPQIQRPLSTLREASLPLPPISEQNAIVSVLGALDDKIELNRRMNETLRTMARALFQNWFVDFDPVRAAGGQFQDSAIGKIPKSWKVERFDKHITADRGLSYKGDGLRDDCTGMPMHNLNSVYEGGGYKHKGIKYYAGEYREKHVLNPGDMIVTNTEQGFDHLLIGYAAIVPKRYGPKGLFSHHIYRVRHKPSSPFSPHYLVELFNNPRWHYWISGFSNGTTINMLPMDALEMPLLVVPPNELVKKFTALATDVHEQVEANLEQTRTLAALRDALLPKLLSGELRAPQAEDATQILIPLFEEQSTKSTRKASDEFVEAIVIAYLTRQLFNGTHPLGRKRYNKLAYLAHRKTEDDVTEHYLKKAAGPYSPWAKYQGPEGIALKRGYVKNGKVGEFTGFLPGDNIAEIDRYVPNYPICAALDWVIGKFKFKRNDDLELLATVDYAALDLLRENKIVSLAGVKQVIATNKEWAAKLKREIFSDANIVKALAELRAVFPKTYQP